MIKIKKAGLGQRLGDAAATAFIRHPRTVGTAVGGAAGAGFGYGTAKIDQWTLPKSMTKGKKLYDPKFRAKVGLGIGAAYGFGSGQAWRNMNKHIYDTGAHKTYNHGAARETEASFNKARRSGNYEEYANRQWEEREKATAAKVHVPTPAWAKGAKTKADAKKRYRDEAMKHHPDRGGSTKKMSDINTEWEKWEKSPGFDKLGYILAGLMDELEKLGTNVPHPLVAKTPSMTPPVSQPRTPVRGRTSAPPNMNQGAGQVSIPPMV